MRAVSFLLLSCCVFAISPAIAQTKPEEDKSKTPSYNPREYKNQMDPVVGVRRERTRRRHYSRPHIERVWIMRPMVKNNTVTNEVSDPIRSFASAIRDPVTFVRYLREEEQLEKKKRQNITVYNRKIPNSRYVQMEIFSQSENEGRIPVLNMVVQQDGEGKMDSTAFMDLMQQVASIPWRTNSSSEEAFDAEFKRQQQQIWVQQLERSNKEKRIDQEQYKLKQNRRTNSRLRDRLREEEVNQSQTELEQLRREHQQRTVQRSQKQKYFRQRSRTSEPFIFFGEFGLRMPNYTRPSVRNNFNRSKSLDILMAPSMYLLPPAESNFRHFNLPQNTLSFNQSPVPKPRGRNSLRRRKRPRPEQSFDVLTTEGPHFLVTANNIHSDVSLLTTEIAPVSTHMPQVPTNAESEASSTAESDASNVHENLPRSSLRPPTQSPTLTSESSLPPSGYEDRIAVSQQPVNFHSSPEVLASPNRITVTENTPIPNAESQNQDVFEIPPPPSPQSVDIISRSEGGVIHPLVNSPSSTDISSSHIHSESIARSDVGFTSPIGIPRPSKRLHPPFLPPPSKRLHPPFLPNEIPVFYGSDSQTYFDYPQVQMSENGFLVTSSPHYNNYPKEEVQSSPDMTQVVIEQQPMIQYNLSSQQAPFDLNSPPVQENYSALMALVMNVFGNKDSDFDYQPEERREQQNQRRRPRPQYNGENSYEELQLTPAESTYYKKRQLTRRPVTLLEITAETGSIPGMPGRDYPIYNRPPKTNFVCVKGRGGYFADIGSRCQAFFVCSDDGRGEPMLCPNGTLFNQDYLVCDWWFNVACEGVS